MVKHVIEPQPEDYGKRPGRTPDHRRKEHINGYDHRPEKRRDRAFKGFITILEFLEQMRPPDYLTDGLLLRGSTYTLTGNTGHCKTLLANLLAIKVALGDWFCGRKCKQGTVIFFAGENPDNVRVQFYSMCWHMQIDPADLDIHFHEGVFDIAKARDRIWWEMGKFPDLALVVVDSLQAFFMGDDDNQNTAMLNFAADFRALTEFHKNRPVGIIAAHPVKNASKDNLLPRGGSAITNELDGNLTAWYDQKIVTMHWLGKFRGIPFDPIKLETVLVKPDGLVDADGNQMPATVIQPLAESRESEIVQDAADTEITVLVAIDKSPTSSERELAMLTGKPKTTVHDAISSLKRRKWIRAYGNKFGLLSEGRRALELNGFVVQSSADHGGAANSTRNHKK